MAEYNGHPSWTTWNINLWVGNEEGLYNLARDCIRQARNREEAAAVMLETLRECGLTETPDGAKYSKSNLRHAMRGL
jgi:hypothetical protein